MSASDPRNPLYEIAEGLGDFFKDDPKKIVYWLFTENLNVGGMSPAAIMLYNYPKGINKVASFVRTALKENRRD